LQGENGAVSIVRDENGVPKIEASSWEDVCFGLGWIHAHDRLVQMEFTSIIAQGRACECLSDTGQMLELDRLFRRVDLAGDARRQAEKLDERAGRIVDAYCRGIGQYLGSHRRPLEFMLIRHQPKAWERWQVIMMVKLMSYLALADGQEFLEHLIVEWVQHGVDIEKLKELFSPDLDGIDCELLKKVKLERTMSTKARMELGKLARFRASNNWVVAGRRSTVGHPILCNDPHLEINRLPPIWYEAQLVVGGQWLAGATVPGFPTVVIGRNRNVAWGVTYTIADSCDLWVEQCRGGRYRQEEEWADFTKRIEIIKRKKREDLELVIYENERGILLGDPSEDGFYLSYNWSERTDCGAETTGRLVDLNMAETVEEGMDAVSGMAMPLNWVFADAGGDIGYQLSGRLPRRRDGWTGLYPVPGWEGTNSWDGWLGPDELPSELNPEHGIIVTANNDRNQAGKPRIINMAMPEYRAERISELLLSEEKVDIDDMKYIQSDLVSLQARRLMPFIEPFLPDDGPAAGLREWRGDYSLESSEAEVFERIYRVWIEKICGPVLDEGWLRWLLDETPLLGVLYGRLDDLLTRDESSWFTHPQRQAAITEAIAGVESKPVRPWKARRKILLCHIMPAKRLPRFLRYQLGPVPLPGNRATVWQGSIFRLNDRLTTYAPSYHLITDMSTETIHTNLPGGPSENPFSRWYLTDMKRFWTGKYKTIERTNNSN